MSLKLYYIPAASSLASRIALFTARSPKTLQSCSMPR
jgi:hypothetical protein